MSTKSLGQLTLDLILKTGSYTEPLDRTTRQTKHQMKEIEKSAQSAGDMVKRSFAALGIGVSLNEIRKYSDAWTDLNGRVRLAVGPMGDANGVMQELEQIARRSYSALETTAEGYLLNATILTELGYRTEEQLRFTNALASGLVASGAKTQRAAAVTNALSKAIAEGVLRGQNWNTVVQQGGLVVDALADSLGVTRSELDQMARAGELTTDKFVGGLIDQFDQLQAKADSMAITVGDALLQLDNAALRIFGTMSEGSGATGLLAASIMGLADNLETVVDIAAIVASVMAGRLAGSAAASAVSFAIATKENIRYQMSLATMAGVSTKAAAGITILDASAKRLNATLGFLGGPVGALVTAAAAIGYFVLTSRNGEQSTDSLRSQIDLLNDSLNSLSREQASRALVLIRDPIEAAEKSVASLSERVEYFKKILAGDGGNEQTRRNWADNLAVAEGDLADATAELERYRQQVKRLQEIINSPSTGRNSLSEEFKKQEAALKRQIALMGDTSEATKLLYEIQAGDLAGKLSESEQQRLIALAEQFDLLKKNTDAARKRAEEDKRAAESLQSMLAGLRETEALLRGQLDSSARLTSSQRDLLKFEQQIADIKAKETLSATEEILLAEEDAVRAQLKKNIQLDGELEKRKAILSLQAYQNNLQMQLTAEQNQYLDRLSAFGMGEKQNAILLERLEIERDITRQKEMALQAMQAGDIDNDQYKAQIDLLDDHLTQRLELFDDYYAQLADKEGDWTNGLSAAFYNYLEQARDIAGQTEDIFGKLFSGLEDNVLEFVKTGEFSMRELMASIADDVIRMLVRIGIQKMATWAIDKLFGTSAAAGYALSIKAQAGAQTNMAALNAFASTAAIPVVGPALAPAAAATAAGIAGGLGLAAIGAATSGIAGMAHSGIDYIPREGTWLLDKGERVLSAKQNEDFSRFLSATEGMQGFRGTGHGERGKVDLNFNFTGLDNDSLLEMLLDNRGTIADMVQMSLEDQGVRLA